MTVGYTNHNEQQVIENTKIGSSSHYNQTIWLVQCNLCNYLYGANGCDLHIRKCPRCQSGADGEKIPQDYFRNREDDIWDFNSGDWVTHEKFGKGVVIGRSKEKYQIKFIGADVKFIVPNVLKSIDGDIEKDNLLDIAGYNKQNIDSIAESVPHIKQSIVSIKNQIKILEGRLKNNPDLEDIHESINTNTTNIHSKLYSIELYLNEQIDRVKIKIGEIEKSLNATIQNQTKTMTLNHGENLDAIELMEQRIRTIESHMSGSFIKRIFSRFTQN